jgi:hypothetical protein
MIQEIRSHFTSAIKAVDGDLKAHKEYFTSENVADSNVENTYFLRIGEMSNQLADSDYSAAFDVTVEIWKNGRNNIIESLDKAYCNAIEILTKAQDQKLIDQLTFIKGVVGTSITPEAIESNDNAAKYTLQFVVTVGYRVN